jgi:NAD+ synthase
MQAVQLEIAKALNVQAPFANQAELEAEVARRVQFIKDCLQNARLKVLVLGISGGVDSLTAGLMAQRAVRELRESTGDNAYQFIAVRLPYHIQHDEHEATASVDFINPDERHTVDIAPCVKALVEQVKAFEGQPDKTVDFVKGNVKARARMVAQYTIAGVRGGLVIGTDHAAEAVMGFFTKFGDGACDLAPLSGLVKNQVRAIARHFGAPEPRSMPSFMASRCVRRRSTSSSIPTVKPSTSATCRTRPKSSVERQASSSKGARLWTCRLKLEAWAQRIILKRNEPVVFFRLMALAIGAYIAF